MLLSKEKYDRALALLAAEFLAIRAYACGPATRWLATIEP